MRILDRYVLSNFLKNYLISLFVLIGMYVVLDMVFNFDEFVNTEAKTGGFATLIETASGVADYYFYQCFLIFVHLSGVIPVVAAAFTLMRFSRNNELTALLAAGVPLLRVATPIIIVAVLLNGLVIVDTELIIPQMIPKLIRKHDEARTTYSSKHAFPVRDMWDNQHNIVSGAWFHPEGKHNPPSIENLDVIYRDADFKPTARLTAQNAVWDETSHKWNLTEGWLTKTQVGPKKVIPLATSEYDGGISPQDIITYHDRSAKAFMIHAMEDQDENVLCAAKFMPEWKTLPPMIEYLDVIYRNADTLDPISHLSADRAIWNAKMQQWDLFNGKRAVGLLPGQSHDREKAIVAYASNITPDEIGLYRSREFVELLPTSRINDILARPKNYGTLDLLRVKHFRFTQPLVNIVLLLLAIPCVLLREPNKLRVATMKCLVLVGLCMGCAFLAQQIAGTPPASAAMKANWPAMMAWMPIFAFGPMSIMLMERVKS